MAAFHDEFEQWTTPKTFLAVLLLTILLAAGLGWGQTRLRGVPGGGVGILDSQIYYSGEQAYQHLQDLGEDGRKIYKGLLFLDLAFAPVYPLFIAVGFGLVWKRFIPGEKRLWKLIPFLFLVTICDWLENILILATLYAYPQHLLLVPDVAGFMTTAKWLFLIFNLALLAIGTGYSIAQRHSPSRRAPPTASS